ncbi:MAG: sigma-54-dependent Fis family transcriptional regulator [Pyrinomonadaceae bacterium]|nr:sigma-54-dependent Fis family transcriptional regulator [Pyrinomonadaceae bacterium]
MSALLSSSSENSAANDAAITFHLPLAAMVRALCRAATTNPDALYEMMLKLALTVDATAETYGLATFAQKAGECPLLRWVEGLDSDEICEAERVVALSLSATGVLTEIKTADTAICLVLAVPSVHREGAAIYGRCVRPLTERQARELRILNDVAQLAHVHAQLRDSVQLPVQAEMKTVVETRAATLPGTIFVSRQMKEIARSVERIKDSKSSVLITGESGTGKELIARSVHRLGRRASAPFIPFNCAATPSDLVESLLFGHRKGAFTGAYADHEGLIRAAEGGTLFLDEIGDLPIMLQPKLLRFLQEGEVHTLGERAPRQVNVRVVAATHKDLERAVREKTFREDLYYRVAALTLHIPPLRERPDDAAALISHYLTYYGRRNDLTVRGITAEAIRALQSYSWPGNVRELAAEIERAMLYADEGALICVENLSPRIRPRSAAGATENAVESRENLDDMLENFERHIIAETLKRCDHNVAHTATALGLGSRQTLYKKLKRLNVNISDNLQDNE